MLKKKGKYAVSKSFSMDFGKIRDEESPGKHSDHSGMMLESLRSPGNHFEIIRNRSNHSGITLESFVIVPITWEALGNDVVIAPITRESLWNHSQSLRNHSVRIAAVQLLYTPS